MFIITQHITHKNQATFIDLFCTCIIILQLTAKNVLLSYDHAFYDMALVIMDKCKGGENKHFLKIYLYLMAITLKVNTNYTRAPRKFLPTVGCSILLSSNVVLVKNNNSLNVLHHSTAIFSVTAAWCNSYFLSDYSLTVTELVLIYTFFSPLFFLPEGRIY